MTIATESPGQTDLSGASDQEIAHLSVIPRGGWSAEEQGEKIKTWLAAGWEAKKRQASRAIAEFSSKGSAQKWFVEWKPASDKAKKFAEVIESALDVVERYYQPIADRGLSRAEDMGLLQSHGRGMSEGIRVKKNPYDDVVLVQICCVTGPANFDPSDNTVEFEPGAKSHVLMLCYRRLPSVEYLEADVCTYPLVTSFLNYQIRVLHGAGGKLIYKSEGFTSKDLCDNGVAAHAPWKDLSTEKRKKLSSMEEKYMNLTEGRNKL